jgi:hypothetical protein
MKSNIKFILVYLIIFCTGFSCNVLDQEPMDAVSNERLFQKGGDAEVAIIGAYRAAAALGQNYLLMAELPTKNVKGNALNRQYEQMNNLLFFDDNYFYGQLWNQHYLLISRVNVVIARVSGITDPSFTEQKRNEILGEARFLRAFAYFNLVRYFGAVPLITAPTTTPDLGVLQVPRDGTDVVYNQIFEDLLFAKNNLPATHSTTLATKARATKNAAYALAVRIHLFRKEYSEVVSNASVILAGNPALNTPYASLYNDRNTANAIWEINFDTQITNSLATTYVVGGLGGVGMIEVNPDILAAYESGDVRYNATFGVFNGRVYMKKYFRTSTGNDNIIVFRLAEVMLSYAEALAETSYPSDLAIENLNKIRTRAQLGMLTAEDLPSIAEFRNQLYKDRRLELSYEGHEWFDLVRTDRLESVLGITDPSKKIWPVPSVEILRNPNLRPQNPGY